MFTHEFDGCLGKVEVGMLSLAAEDCAGLAAIMELGIPDAANGFHSLILS
jgi:hypothetical protein